MQQSDLIITNACVITMDVAQPFAQSLAIAGNKIIAVGSNDGVMQLRTKHTRVIDASLKTVMP